MSKKFKFLSVISIILGILFIIGGGFGACYIYQSVAQEKIVTPEDASIPNKPVRGPFTLMVQADIIREHTLKITGGKTFAEMPYQVPKLDEKGKPVLDKDGKPVMVGNSARDIWVTATTLRTALYSGILAYGVCGLSAVIGFILLCCGMIIRKLSGK